jgi:hypothetical protein
MILITSGAFITPELQVELGHLPPAFLPLGNRRLYDHQARAIRKAFPRERVFLSIPDTYAVSDVDLTALGKLELEVIRVPVNLSLGASILHVITHLALYEEPLRILHGDTLVAELPNALDVISVAVVEDDYPWELEGESSVAGAAWCGYFCFSSTAQFAEALVRASGNFVRAVRLYQEGRPQSYALTDTWLDLGHVNTYFRTRASVTTERSFNDLRIDSGVVRKTGSDRRKIEAEALWYRQLPRSLKRYAPQLISFEQTAVNTAYSIEYLPLLPLNELFVHGQNSPLFWRRIYSLAQRLLAEFEAAVELREDQKKSAEESYRLLVCAKTDERLAEYMSSVRRDLDAPTLLNGQVLPSLRQVASECQEAALLLPAHPGVLHGDFCFSNVLYDARSNALKIVDPRGLDAFGHASILGDLRYDIAKFTHSVIGLYDHIISGRFHVTEKEPMEFTLEILTTPAVDAAQREYENHFAGLGIRSQDILPLTVLLFLSMPPLHADQPARQIAFLANALRLYLIWKTI